MPNANQGFNWQALLAAVASQVPHVNEARVRRRQTEDLEAGQLAMRRRQQEADRLLGEEIAATAAESPEEAQIESLRDYTAALQQVRARGNASTPAPTSLGDEFAAGKKQANQDVALRSSDRARQLATVQGSTRMRERAGQRRGRLQAELDTQGQAAEMDAFLAQLRARNRFANPYTQLISQLGTRIAAGYQPGARRVGADPRVAVPMIDPSTRPNTRGLA